MAAGGAAPTGNSKSFGVSRRVDFDDRVRRAVHQPQRAQREGGVGELRRYLAWPQRGAGRPRRCLRPPRFRVDAPRLAGSSHTNQTAPAPKASSRGPIRTARRAEEHSIPSPALSPAASRSNPSAWRRNRSGVDAAATPTHSAPPPNVRSLGSPPMKSVCPRSCAGNWSRPVPDARDPDAQAETHGLRVDAYSHLRHQLVRLRRSPRPSWETPRRAHRRLAARRRETGGDSGKHEAGRTDEHPATCLPCRMAITLRPARSVSRRSSRSAAGVAPAGVLSEGAGEDRVERFWGAPAGPSRAVATPRERAPREAPHRSPAGTGDFGQSGVS